MWLTATDPISYQSATAGNKVTGTVTTSLLSKWGDRRQTDTVYRGHDQQHHNTAGFQQQNRSTRY